jgi:hypothetical protein
MQRLTKYYGIRKDVFVLPLFAQGILSHRFVDIQVIFMPKEQLEYKTLAFALLFQACIVRAFI